MVSYKDLGLVNTREMFAKAIKGGYAVPAFNFFLLSFCKILHFPQFPGVPLDLGM